MKNKPIVIRRFRPDVPKPICLPMSRTPKEFADSCDLSAMAHYKVSRSTVDYADKDLQLAFRS